MVEKANGLPLRSLCIKEAPVSDRLPTPMWKRIDRWREHQGYIRRLRAYEPAAAVLSCEGQSQGEVFLSFGKDPTMEMLMRVATDSSPAFQV